MKVRANDNVHYGGLADLVMLETARLVYLKHEWSYLVKFALFFVNDRNHVHGFCGHVIKCAQVDILESHVDEVAELFGILKIAIVNQLHEQQVVEEELGLGEDHDLACSLSGAVQLSIDVLLDRGRVDGQLQSSEEVWQEVREDQDDI